MPNDGLTLKEKYALLRKKQLGGSGPEKSISKKAAPARPATNSAEEGDKNREQLLLILEKKRQEEAAAEKAKKSSGRKLPSALQRALAEDPDLIRNQKVVLSTEPEAPSDAHGEMPGSDVGMSGRMGRRSYSHDGEDEFFVKRKTPLYEEANKTYKDEDGEEYFMCTVFVGDIGPDVKEYHLEDAFSSFGPVLSARIINDKPYGFVKFSQREHADRAIATMNGYILRGAPIRVSSAKVPSAKSHHRPRTYSNDYNSGNTYCFEDRSVRAQRNLVDVLPDRDMSEEVPKRGDDATQEATPSENYGHLGSDDSIADRGLVTYDDV